MSQPGPRRVGDIPQITDTMAEQLADTMFALSAPSRVQILGCLLAGPRSVTDLTEALGMEQSAVSHQLRVLRDHKLVRAERRAAGVSTPCTTSTSAALLEAALRHSARPQAPGSHGVPSSAERGPAVRGTPTVSRAAAGHGDRTAARLWFAPQADRRSRARPRPPRRHRGRARPVRRPTPGRAAPGAAGCATAGGHGAGRGRDGRRQRRRRHVGLRPGRPGLRPAFLWLLLLLAASCSSTRRWSPGWARSPAPATPGSSSSASAAAGEPSRSATCWRSTS